jgi:hypothetical protein
MNEAQLWFRETRNERQSPMATPNQVREVVRAQPFVPFVIHLADGRKFDVRHPEFAAVSPNGRELLSVADDQGIHQFEMLLVAEIETPPPVPPTNPSPSPSGRGQG